MRTEETLELRWILKVIRRWGWLIVLCSVLALGVALFVTSRMAPVYEATTTLLMAPAEQTMTSEFNMLMAGEKLALTYVQLLKGHSNLQTAIERLGLKMTPEVLAKRVQIDSVPDTQLVRVTVRSDTPAGATQLANTIADVSVEFARILQEHRYRDYLQNKEARIAAQLSEIEATQAQVDSVTEQRIAYDVEVSRLQGLLNEQQVDLERERQNAQALQLLVERVKDNVKIVEAAPAPAAEATAPYTATLMLLVDQGTANVGTGYSLVLTTDQLALTYSQIVTRQSVLDAAIAKLGAENSPDPQEVTVKAEPLPGSQLVRLQVSGQEPAQTANLANALAEVFVEQIQGLLVTPHADRLKGREAEVSRLAELIGATKLAIESQTAKGMLAQSALSRLQANLIEYRSNYRILEQELDQARLISSQAAGTIVITERAQESPNPTGSTLLYVLLAVTVAGLVGFGAALLIEYLDESVKTPEDVNHALGLSCLGIIEQYGREAEKPIVTPQPHSRITEAFRMLAANVRLAALEGSPRIVLVTSPGPGDGKTSVAANLAVAAASAGLRVIVVDADLRKPKLHELFDLNKVHGLSDALLPERPNGYLKSTAVEGVRVLTSGKSPEDPVGVVSSPRLAKLFSELKQEAELVIVDSPPVLAVADATILATLSDDVLLVVRSGRTASQAARRATGALRQTKAHLLGAVLTGVAVRSDGYYGRYYYSQAEETARPQSRLKRVARFFS